MKIFHAFAAAVLIPLLLSLSSKAAPATGTYGAFAYSPSNHAVAAVGYGNSAVEAENAAVAACYKHASDCLPVVWFTHAYATFEVGTHGAWSWGTSSTLTGADANANNWCKTHGGGSSCRVIRRAETTSPSAAVNQSDLKARMCMINDPSGAIPFHKKNFVGHVGWAYLKNRDTGQWEYGANEGPTQLLGSSSKTWYRDGTWARLVTAFTQPLGKGKDKNYYHAAGRYQTFRCSSEPIGYTSAAHSDILSQQGQPYILSLTTPGNDCLSNAVDVLAADGNPGVSDDAGLPNALPNWYYAHGLYHFGMEWNL